MTPDELNQSSKETENEHPYTSQNVVLRDQRDRVPLRMKVCEQGLPYMDTIIRYNETRSVKAIKPF